MGCPPGKQHHSCVGYSQRNNHRHLPLGYKDYALDVPQLRLLPFETMPSLGTTAAGQEILLGGFSGLFFEGINPENGNLQFITHPDRGANADATDVDEDEVSERPFPLPITKHNGSDLRCRLVLHMCISQSVYHSPKQMGPRSQACLIFRDLPNWHTLMRNPLICSVNRWNMIRMVWTLKVSSVSGGTYVLERDSAIGPDSQKYVFHIDLASGTNIHGMDEPMPFESLDEAQLLEQGIIPVIKTLVINLAAAGYDFADKPEGLALLNEDIFAVLNDNDFGLVGSFDLATGLLDDNPSLQTPLLGIVTLHPMDSIQVIEMKVSTSLIG